MSTKYFCKVCRLYIDDNKAQRLQHENGSKHRDAVEKSRNVAREQKLEVLANERKLAQTLQSINRAARKDLSLDKDESTPTSGSGLPPDSSVFHGAGGGFGGGFSGIVTQPNNEASDVNDEGDDEDYGDEGMGIYEEGKKFYMKGEVHVEKLQPGTFCELFVEEMDAWVPASVSLRHDVVDSDSETVSTSFDCTYFPQVSDPAPPGWRDNVRPQDLRLAYEKPAPSSSAGSRASNIDESQQQNVEENTGLGKWESVLVVDEPNEVADDRVKDEHEPQKEPAKKGNKREYRGVSLQTTRSLENDISEGKMTKFKKRRMKE